MDACLLGSAGVSYNEFALTGMEFRRLISPASHLWWKTYGASKIHAKLPELTEPEWHL
jgi:hypothetical protein